MVKLNSTRIYRKIEALMGLKVNELLAWFPYGITNNVDRPFTHIGNEMLSSFQVLYTFKTMAINNPHNLATQRQMIH